MRKFYHEHEGVFKLRDPETLERAHQNAKAAEKAARKEAMELRKRVEQFKDLEDINPDEYRKMMAERQAAEEREAEKKGEWDKLKAQQNEQHQEQLTAKEREIERLNSALRTQMIDSELNKELVANEATTVGIKLLPYDLRQKVSLVEEEGKFHVRILGDDGKTPRVNADGDYLQIVDLVKEQREIFPDLFKGSAASGGGVPTSGATNGVAAHKAKAAKEMQPGEKAAFIAEHGLSAWRELLAAS
jgi:hypothetical protein